MVTKGIDVSRYQGSIDWSNVKADGIQFAMLKATYGWDNDKQIDPMLASNIHGCTANKIHFGFYHYSYAMNVDDAKREAAFFLRHIKNYRPSMPVAFDFEEPMQVGGTDAQGIKYPGLPVDKQLEIIDAFIQAVEKAGYFVMLYSSANVLQRLYDAAPRRIERYACWVAHINAPAPAFTGTTGMWQYSWKGNVRGIKGDVDMNLCYRDYPYIIKRAGLNGW